VNDDDDDDEPAAEVVVVVVCVLSSSSSICGDAELFFSNGRYERQVSNQSIKQTEWNRMKQKKKLTSTIVLLLGMRGTFEQMRMTAFHRIDSSTMNDSTSWTSALDRFVCHFPLFQEKKKERKEK
jgi:hypothetical protein